MSIFNYVYYLGKGTGDLNIQSSISNNIMQSGIYQIEDCIIYDPTQHMLPDNYDGKRYSKNVADCSNNCYMSMIGKRTGGTQYIWQAGFSIADSELSETTSHNWIAQGGHYTGTKGIIYLDNKTDYRVDGTTVNNREYLYEVILIDNDLTFVMTDLTNNTQVYNQTIHIAEDLTGKYLQLMRMGNPSWYYRELKFKLLPDNNFSIALDGTETKTQISGSTSISNGIMSGGASYITSSKIDNSRDWEITLDAKFSGNGCGVWLIKSGTTVRDKNRLIFVNNARTSNNRSAFLLDEDGQSQKYTQLDIRYPNYNTYTSCLFKKQGDIYSITLDDTYTMTLSTPTFATTCPELCIGVDSWGATCSIKNIKIKYL